MNETYVFDFYNLYIPKKMKYEKLEIKIAPLKIAKEFKTNRTKLANPHYNKDWKTAKCLIRAKTEKEAVKVASWLEFLYSFAQRRSVFFLSWYKYKNGKRYSSYQSKFIQPTENGSSVLVSGVRTKNIFFTKDISLFINIALKKLSEAKEEERNRILVLLHALATSNSQMSFELKFLICWFALEKLANAYYSSYKSKNKMLTKNEI